MIENMCEFQSARFGVGKFRLTYKTYKTRSCGRGDQLGNWLHLCIGTAGDILVQTFSK